MKLCIITSFDLECTSLSICSAEAVEDLRGEGCRVLVLGDADPRLDDLLNEAIALAEIACRDLCFVEPETLDLEILEARLVAGGEVR
jgi:hypothetical protein